jgi:hypothetical protein
MKSHGQASRYVRCQCCGRRFKRFASQLKRNRFSFCSRACTNRMRARFAAHCEREFARLNPEVYAELQRNQDAEAA